MRTCDDRQVPRPSTGRTPVRNARIPDEVWLPALAKAETEGRSASDAMTAALRRYAAEPLLSAYEFTFDNWPEAGEWVATHLGAFERMDAELSEATGFLTSEWLSVATWLAATHHRIDWVQQRRVITGHILRRALEENFGAWRDRYRDTRHLSETVQVILEKHLPLAEDS